MEPMILRPPNLEQPVDKAVILVTIEFQRKIEEAFFL